MRRQHPAIPALLALGLALAWPGALRAAEEEAEPPKEAAKEQVFKIELRGKDREPYVGISKEGQAPLGSCYEVRRQNRLVGCAEVEKLEGPWPKLRYILGTGHAGDDLVPLAPAVPMVELLTDDKDSREAKELKALLGDRLFVAEIGDQIVVRSDCKVMVALIHSGAPFIMGDSVVQPFARNGGTVVCDTMLYAQIRGIVADEAEFKEPPVARFIFEGPLTAGIPQETRIPWFGTKGKKFVARCLAGLVREEPKRLIATDGSTENTAILEEDLGGPMLVLDLVSLNGRAGMDPGSKNKWILPARLMGTGPRRSRYLAGKPGLDAIDQWFQALYERHQDTVTKKFEGGGATQETFVHSYTIGARDKPLVLLLGGVRGSGTNDWLGSVALVTAAEYLADNPERDYKVDWLLQRLRVRFIPVLSRYGYSNDTALNDRKVDVDLNFPYNWEALPAKARRGEKPFSETESAIVQRIVEGDKAVALLDVGVDPYEAGYRIIRARDGGEDQHACFSALRDLVNARIRHRFVLGDQPLQLRLTRAGTAPSAVNWAGSKGVYAASLRVCGDAEDSLTNTDVAIEGILAFLWTSALRLEPAPPPEPAEPPKPPAKTPTKAPTKKTGD